MIHRVGILLFVLLSLSQSRTVGQENNGSTDISHAEQLRGAITPERAWWDLLHYRLALAIDPESKTIEGSNRIRFRVLEPQCKMQIDLQEPLTITEISWNEQPLSFEREGSVYWVTFPRDLQVEEEPEEIEIFYAGTPVVSVNPPWSGGFSWQTDDKGTEFIATSCQGIGASIWWPCKDHGYDEPDEGIDTVFTVPEHLVAVSNGRLVNTEHNEASNTKTYRWRVTNPINNYCVNLNIGNYIELKDSFEGAGGQLDLSYWVLAHQREKAQTHFREVPRTLAAFEHWFGQYPFYEDSYKLVVVPYLGMEHQSSVTYGNGFANGYRGTDLSDTGVGLQFDFIIVHESGHEWWGNNVSMKDVADMWIHESFTNYSENLFVEYHFTQDEAERYVIGCRKRIVNDRPIIGTYNANRAGSKDMYYKGGNMLHTLRHVINDDEKWRSILIGLNTEFWHQVVTTEEVEKYISEQAGKDLSKFFDQYLRGTQIPVLVYSTSPDKRNLAYHFDDVVEGFTLPVKVQINGQETWLEVSEAEQTLELTEDVRSVELDRNFYIKMMEASEASLQSDES